LISAFYGEVGTENGPLFILLHQYVSEHMPSKPFVKMGPIYLKNKKGAHLFSADYCKEMLWFAFTP